VKHRHVLRSVLQNAAVALVVTLVTGDVSSTAAAAGAAPAYLLQGKFSRAFEREADAEGVRLMLAGGLDPEHLAVMLERLEKAHRPSAEAGEGEEGAERVMDYIGTHPPTHERLRAIREADAGKD
jgi:Zn-dependent protease with chaperone function